MKQKKNKPCKRFIKDFFIALSLFSLILLAEEGWAAYLQYQYSDKLQINVAEELDEKYSVREIIKKTPLEVLKGISEVRVTYIPEISFLVGLEDGDVSDFSGYYKPYLNQIVIYQPYKPFQFSFYHELGHHIWLNALTEKEKIEWYNITRKYPHVPIREYSTISYVEEFCDEFASYMVNYVEYDCVNNVTCHKKVSLLYSETNQIKTNSYPEKNRYNFINSKIQRIINNGKNSENKM